MMQPSKHHLADAGSAKIDSCSIGPTEQRQELEQTLPCVAEKVLLVATMA